jgi:hypothetical protein
MHMTRLCTLMLVLPLALNCRAEGRPPEVTPQQVDQILNHLSENLSDYVFPETGAELKRQLQAHRSEYRALTDTKALATRLTNDLRAVGRDKHLEVSYGDEMGFEKDLTPEEVRQRSMVPEAMAFAVPEDCRAISATSTLPIFQGIAPRVRRSRQLCRALAERML